ncbi:hypothetical protein KSP39_PZI022709 [Platanthera zijinensis]|uniref:Uncharacterized protein n=1 Tax=Platanthera zijinensis TaxID=2320716 RepID=A0AAP0FV59_9ASPA
MIACAAGASTCLKFSCDFSFLIAFILSVLFSMQQHFLSLGSRLPSSSPFGSGRLLASEINENSQIQQCGEAFGAHYGVHIIICHGLSTVRWNFIGPRQHLDLTEFSTVVLLNGGKF